MAQGVKTGGRQTGTPNKTTSQARAAIALFVDGNVEKLNSWLDSIAAKDPKDAFNCFMSVLEYNIPKLARTELTGEDGGPIQTELAESDRAILAHYMKTKGDK